jgi:hypothetical protein
MTNSEPKQKPKPIHEVKLGRVRAAIWENATDKGTWCKVTFSRLFKDKSNKWQDSDSFAKEDLLLLAEVVRQAALILYHDEPDGQRTEGPVGQG